tara:strand:+ start:1462 stop:1587 length:126 start_codon:yes stop_codon:yes gene_type:complete
MSIKLWIYNNIVLRYFGDYIDDDIGDYVWENADEIREMIRP